MRILVATDSYKGSLSSLEAGEAIKKGILKAKNDASVDVVPLADGGEGTCFALCGALNAETVSVKVTSPVYGKKIICEYGISEKTAIMEMASAAGITLVSGKEKTPIKTTTYGVGEMIADAIKRGCDEFIIGLGGSATNDCGIGMLSALGYNFTDKNGKKVKFGAEGIRDVVNIDCTTALKGLEKCKFTVACDVTNTLYGKNGCSYVFAKQKGATSDEIEKMDLWIKNYSGVVKEKLGVDYADVAGSGAAGGLGYAFLSFFNAQLRSGAELVLEASEIDKKIEEADVVVTGEGKLDGQSLYGKAPVAIARAAKNKGKKVLAFCGCLGDEVEKCNEYFDGFFSIQSEAVSLEKALEKKYAEKNLTMVTQQVFRLL